jgi:hypothetical protein
VTVARTRGRRRRRISSAGNGVGGEGRILKGIGIRGEAIDIDERREEIVVGGKVVGGRWCGGGEGIHEHEHGHIVGARSAVEGRRWNRIGIRNWIGGGDNSGAGLWDWWRI